MEKLKKHITIGITDTDQCGIQISPEMQASEAFQLTGTLALHILNSYFKVATSQLSNLSNEELNAAYTGIKESMYDAMDNVFSTVLAQFYPSAPKYSIEDEAILELTNKLIEERYDQLTPEEQKAYSEGYRQTRARLEETRAESEGA